MPGCQLFSGRYLFTVCSVSTYDDKSVGAASRRIMSALATDVNELRLCLEGLGINVIITYARMMRLRIVNLVPNNADLGTGDRRAEFRPCAISRAFNRMRAAPKVDLHGHDAIVNGGHGRATVTHARRHYRSVMSLEGPLSDLASDN